MRLLAVAAWLIVALSPLPAEPIDVDFERAQIDLLPRVEAVESFSPQVTIELPAAASTPRQAIALNGQGPGPLYRWAVFTLHNPQPEPQELVIAAPHQRFVASRVLWPRPEGSRVVGLASSEGRIIKPLASLGADTFALTVPPGATISYVLEVSATGLNRLSLWQRGAFHAVADWHAFFRGMVLGISFVLAIGFICLFVVRPRSVFPTTALFGWSAVAFLAIEAGYLPAILGGIAALSGSELKVRALVEGLMLVGVIGVLVSFVELRRQMPLIGNALVVLGAAAAALTLYGWFESRLAIGVARIVFAGVVVAGLAILVVLWQRGVALAQASMVVWAVLALWTVAAGVGALDLVDGALMQPLISAGLVLVLVTMGFTLVQFAFGFGLASSGAVEEAGRRALALGASDQAVWDWQVDRARLHVGPEIERALGLERGAVGHDPAAWLELIHPADRLAYGAAIEAARRRGRGRFYHEFRLRRGDGSYRWHVLRGRALSGGKDAAVRLIGTLADVTVLRQSEDRLLADAVRDRLTGLPNRALFVDRLAQAMRRTGDAANAGLYVIAIDLDRFKSFNEALGPEAGDFLLNTAGRRLQGCIGPEDTLARLPGHQFAIIWSGTTQDTDESGLSGESANSGNSGHRRASGIEELIDALSDAVAQPVHLPVGEVIMTVSMGVVRCRPEHHSAEGALKDAEIALYEAKRGGDGAVEFFRPDMHDERSALLQLEQNLRRALDRNEIEVVYQPIIRLGDRKLAGFEALMRWRRGDNVLEPDSFVGLAEETGIIRELGRYVLKEATSRLGVWQRAFRPQDPLFVAVNISSVQLLNGDLVEDIRGLLEREDLKPHTLKLELTESLVVENPELAHKLLMRLKQMGVALACDDFGTGYSGLESVFRLPFDAIKIDRCFLEGESGDRNWVVVGAMLRLAGELGLDVIAEGIETDEQMERLCGLGCEYGQGFLIGPPVTAQQVVEALGGFSYGANAPTGHMGAGLKALWASLIGRKPAAPVGHMTPGMARTRIALYGAASENGAASAPMPSHEVAAPPVIDLRSIMPAASKPAPGAPKVGSAPLAPRRAKPAEPAEPAEPTKPTKPAEPAEPSPPQATTHDPAVAVEAESPPGPVTEPSAAQAAGPTADGIEISAEPDSAATSAAAPKADMPHEVDKSSKADKPHKPKPVRGAGAKSLRRRVRRAARAGSPKMGSDKPRPAKQR